MASLSNVLDSENPPSVAETAVAGSVLGDSSRQSLLVQQSLTAERSEMLDIDSEDDGDDDGDELLKVVEQARASSSETAPLEGETLAEVGDHDHDADNDDDSSDDGFHHNFNDPVIPLPAPSSSSDHQLPQSMRLRNLYVACLDLHISRDALKQIFIQFGEVTSVRVLLDSKTGQSRGVGFVGYKNPESARLAISALHRTTTPYNSTPLLVRFSEKGGETDFVDICSRWTLLRNVPMDTPRPTILEYASKSGVVTTLVPAPRQRPVMYHWPVHHYFLEFESPEAATDFVDNADGSMPFPPPADSNGAEGHPLLLAKKLKDLSILRAIQTNPPWKSCPGSRMTPPQNASNGQLATVPGQTPPPMPSFAGPPPTTMTTSVVLPTPTTSSSPSASQVVSVVDPNEGSISFSRSNLQFVNSMSPNASSFSMGAMSAASSIPQTNGMAAANANFGNPLQSSAPKPVSASPSGSPSSTGASGTGSPTVGPGGVPLLSANPTSTEVYRLRSAYIKMSPEERIEQLIMQASELAAQRSKVAELQQEVQRLRSMPSMPQQPQQMQVSQQGQQPQAQGQPQQLQRSQQALPPPQQLQQPQQQQQPQQPPQPQQQQQPQQPPQQQRQQQQQQPQQPPQQQQQQQPQQPPQQQQQAQPLQPFATPPQTQTLQLPSQSPMIPQQPQQQPQYQQQVPQPQQQPQPQPQPQQLQQAGPGVLATANAPQQQQPLQQYQPQQQYQLLQPQPQPQQQQQQQYQHQPQYQQLQLQPQQPQQYQQQHQQFNQQPQQQQQPQPVTNQNLVQPQQQVAGPGPTTYQQLQLQPQQPQQYQQYQQQQQLQTPPGPGPYPKAQVQGLPQPPSTSQTVPPASNQGAGTGPPQQSLPPPSPNPPSYDNMTSALVSTKAAVNNDVAAALMGTFSSGTPRQVQHQDPGSSTTSSGSHKFVK